MGCGGPPGRLSVPYLQDGHLAILHNATALLETAAAAAAAAAVGGEEEAGFDSPKEPIMQASVSCLAGS